MFSDTHFHFHHLIERGLDGTEILSRLVERNMFFGLDIGTKCDDLLRRHVQIQETVAKLPDFMRKPADEMIYYSAGIWPDVEEIKNRIEAVKKLEDSIESFMDKSHLVAIGECGLDHHWNPSGVDGRCESDFDKSVYEGERELFQMQIALAKKMHLPVIVHSRDAFEDTLDCIKNMVYYNGIIHCYSYGKDEARKFLDLGLYIAFGGAVTYTKKAKIEEMAELLRFVPDDRILLETDSPYLAPVPLRGQTNTPVFIEHVYNYIAQARGVLPGELSVLVDKNIRGLFSLKC
ncbi:TatD family hydrolase [Treponema sp.]|uniref:TatD family hydrolase n=1 Tax=Treponema sp. TaxID=166 RepID=UPI0038904F07